MRLRIWRGSGLLLVLVLAWMPGLKSQTLQPIRQVLDLNVKESATVRFARRQEARITLTGVSHRTDSIRDAIREAAVEVTVDGKPYRIVCGNYRLPVEAGEVQIDCPITGGYLGNSRADSWALEKAARIRVWPQGAEWMQPESFGYPVKQRWFASGTQMSNEPTFVDGGEIASDRKIYYHSGLDIGGAEGLVEVIAATDGVVASRGEMVGEDFKGDTPVEERYDVVYLKDERGWFYRYSHLYSIDESVRPGGKIRKGDPIGLLGKEGGSGGWSHLHFEIKARQPSGRWGTEEGYAYLWQAYQRQFGPALIAVARPHWLLAQGEMATLDGSRSQAPDASIRSYEWTFTDGSTAAGAKVERRYDRLGSFSEILKVTDSKGRVSYDFAVVQVQPKQPGEKLTDVPPAVHAVYYPALEPKAGQPITFKARAFRTTEGEEVWDFGDGSPARTTKSDGNAVKLAKDGYAVISHTYDKAGDYLVRVERRNRRGEPGIAHVWVHVAP